MIPMTDERDDEEPQEPSDEELERTEAEFFEDAANEPVLPLERQILKAEGLFPPSIEDLDLIDAFPSRSPYMKEEWRISHALIRSTGVEKPTDLLEWWAPYRLVRPDELAEADYIADIDPLLIERGVAEGAARVKGELRDRPSRGGGAEPPPSGALRPGDARDLGVLGSGGLAGPDQASGHRLGRTGPRSRPPVREGSGRHRPV
jgi:hypothetical protein